MYGGEHGVVPPQDSAAGSGPFWPFFVVGPASVMAAAWVVVLVWLGVEVAKYAKPPGAEQEAKQGILRPVCRSPKREAGMDTARRGLVLLAEAHIPAGNGRWSGLSDASADGTLQSPPRPCGFEPCPCMSQPCSSALRRS